jgi:tRNA (guanine-N7-)-methyltransferase
MVKHQLNEYPSIALRSEDLSGPIDFAQLFGRSAPVHIEVGTGKGTFLLNEARARPEVNFIGIEWARPFYLFSLDRFGRWGLPNVRIIHTDAAIFLSLYVPSESVDCFHIYFPDPWPKKSHRKKRMLQQYNMPFLIRSLKPGGEIRIATDHAEYFEQIERVVDLFSDVLEPVEFTRPAGAKEGELVGTNYERKYLQDKRAVRTLALRKRPIQ